MKKVHAEIILKLAECDLNVTETARRCYMHRKTIHYRIRQIVAETGLNPTKFYDICQLLPVAHDIMDNHGQKKP